MPARRSQSLATAAAGRSRRSSGSGTITKSFSVPWPLRKAIARGLRDASRVHRTGRRADTSARAVGLSRSHACRSAEPGHAPDGEGDQRPRPRRRRGRSRASRGAAGAAARQAGPGVADAAGGHHAPARGAAADQQARAWRPPRRRRRSSKASGKANISEPRAASATMGASCQIRSRRCGRSSKTLDLGRRRPARPSESSGSRRAASGVSSGPSGLSRRRIVLAAVPCVLAACREGRPPSPRALPTRTPLVDRSSMMARSRGPG